MIERNKNLKALNTMGIDCNASLYLEIYNEEDVYSVWKSTLLSLSSPLILGGGSNVLFSGNYSGLILKNNIKSKEIINENDEEIWVRLGGGENWHETVVWTVNHGWGGIENLSLIPGTVGAAPIQNIGAYGVELKDVFEYLEAFDLIEGKKVVLSKADCMFGYRDSIFKSREKGRYFILNVILKLSKNPKIHVEYGDIQKTLQELHIEHPTIADVSQAVITIRSSKLPDPAVLGNCGSFFKNPIISAAQFEKLKMLDSEIKGFPQEEGKVKISAAWLIEKDGWKGKRVGNTGSHEKQALVLVNYGNATGKEIVELAMKIQSSVFNSFGVVLEPEVNFLPSF